MRQMIIERYFIGDRSDILCPEHEMLNETPRKSTKFI